VTEIVRHRRRVAAGQHAEENQPNQRRALCGREDVLDDSAVFQPAGVRPGEERDQQNADELGGRERQGVLSAQVERRHDEAIVGDPGHQRAEVAREPDRHRRDRAGLDDQKERPAVEKAPDRRERFAEIDVLAAGARHHRRELAVRQRPDDRQQPCDHPPDQQPPRTADRPRHVGGHDEDSRPDHRADHHHGRVVETQPARELGVERGRRHGGFRLGGRVQQRAP
jgi:hypothetical protein